MLVRILLFLVGVGACGAGCFDRPSSTVDAGVPQICSLAAEIENTPGFPFNPKSFREQVWPVLDAQCGAAGCHGPTDNQGEFTIWPVSDEPCDFVNSFNTVYAHTDFRNHPLNSRVYASVDGSNPDHPVVIADQYLDIIRDYVMAAHEAYQQVSGPVDPSQLFDEAKYRSVIQPMFDGGGCLVAGCHDTDTAAAGFGLTPMPEVDSAEMKNNFRTVLNLIDFSTGQAGAKLSRLYVRATDDHRGVRVSEDDAEALLAWIKAGLPEGSEPPPPGCADVDKFNVEVFRDQIMPILTGDRDLNDLDDTRNITGCTRTPCHGEEREAGTLYLAEDETPEDNLRRFACFVDLVNPAASQVLACPLKLSQCTVNPHPGDDIFFGYEDRNYQRILSYLYAANNEATPLDFAFFVRKVEPILNDVSATGTGGTGLSCADTRVCHGVQIAGTKPGNQSNFGIVPNTSVAEKLLLNFLAAANFTHFQEPEQSSLLLYPTNEIANLDNDLATGLPHPGGAAFAFGDAQADIIRQWSGGLRPDEQGFQRHWLVAGDFAASDILAEALSDEGTARPRIFDDSGQSPQFNLGRWDGFFAQTTFIDLNSADFGFFRPAPSERLAYAVSYVINGSALDIEAKITVQSPNDVMLWVGDTKNIGRDGNGTSVVATLPAYASSLQVTRIMVKVFQSTDEAEFGFDLQIAELDGDPLTAASKELIIKLSPEGGM